MRETLGSMTQREFLEWQVFAKHEPIGGARADYHAAMIAYSITAAAPRKKGRKPPAFDKFIARWWKDLKPDKSPLDLLRFAAEITRQAGGEISPEVEAVLAGEQPWEIDGDAGP